MELKTTFHLTLGVKGLIRLLGAMQQSANTDPEIRNIWGSELVTQVINEYTTLEEQMKAIVEAMQASQPQGQT